MRIPVWLHILLIICFMAMPVLSAPHAFDEGFSIFRGPTIRMLMIYALFIGFFYAHYYFFLDRYFFTKKYIVYSLLLAVSFALILLIPELFKDVLMRGSFSNGMPGEHHHHHGPPHDHRPPMWGEVPRHFFLFATTVLLGHFVKINERLRLARQEKTQAELSYLKSQVNPHFLFNTLNTIYSLALTRNEKTPEAVIQLSGMMRHVLIDSRADFIPLSKEVEYIKNYVALQKLRLDESVKLEFTIDGDTRGKNIAPLLLIPFIENAFKHGVNAEEDSEIIISIVINESEISLLVKNRKVNVQMKEEDRTGVGLGNVRERLKLLYPDKHHLKMESDKNYFEVNLKISIA